MVIEKPAKGSLPGAPVIPGDECHRDVNADLFCEPKKLRKIDESVSLREQRIINDHIGIHPWVMPAPLPEGLPQEYHRGDIFIGGLLELDLPGQQSIDIKHGKAAPNPCH